MRSRTRLNGWRSRHGRTPRGAIESRQRVELDGPVVEFTERGGYALGRAYWAEVTRSTLGLVRSATGRPGVHLCVLGRGPALLELGEPEVVVTPSSVRCRHTITGGVLTRRPQGHITFEQAAGERLELSSTLCDFVPALGARGSEPHWTGALYDQLQRRLHVVVSRRFFAHLIRTAPR